MNLLIETLNAWADHFLRFAWPMLWQSSLLIVVLLTLDWMLKRKVRPAVRYALWLVVLVKLLLPPSLAFPTSIGWWLRSANAPPTPPRHATVVVTYDAEAQPQLPTPSIPVFTAPPPPPPRLLPATWAVIGMAAVSLGMLAWMLVRWRQVAREARRAATAPEWLGELLQELPQPAQLGRVSPVGARTKEPPRREGRSERSGEEGAETNHPSAGDPPVSDTGLPLRPSRLCGLTGRSSTAWLRLRLTDNPQSPAVCGLFRPVILLPRSLAEHLPPAQLRAVLLHELLHLRRGDVWVNCAQGLLQILYWWHPLLWLANARIRRVREEAVDDAVMLALNEDAETYAPTLLEVAKLALHRPLASLGLVGILESRSSLRQRIERLMDFRPPHRAGLGLVSALGVLGFAALAVPMGEAPAPTAGPGLAAVQVVTNGPAPATPSHTGLKLDKRAKVSRLVQDGKLLFEMGKLDQAEAKLKEALKEDPQDQAALYYFNLVPEARVGRSRGQPPEQLPVPNPYARTSLVQASPGRRAIISKLDRIRLESVAFEGLPLSQVLRSLADEARERDPEKLGINFVLTPGTSTNTAGEGDLFSLPITIQPPLTNIRLADVLDALVKVAGRPIRYSIEDYAVVFSGRAQPESPPLYVRTFKVDPAMLLDSLHIQAGPSASMITPIEKRRLEMINAAVRDHFTKAGADMDSTKNPGKAIFYNDRQGMLIVRATMEDLDIIEAAIQVLNTAPPQINIKAKFVEFSQDDTKALGWDWFLGNVVITNGSTGGQIAGPPSPNGPTPAASQAPTLLGILTEPQRRMVLKAIEQRAGTELVAQPEVTTLSGRQAQCKVADVRTIATGVKEQALTPPGITTTNEADISVITTESVECGLFLDITPAVLPDGYTVSVPLVVSLLEFLGYEDSQTNRLTVYVNGKSKQVSPPRPAFRSCQITSQVNVLDGRTLVLGGLVSERIITMKGSVPVLGDLPLVGPLFRSESKNTQKRNLLVFITPTIVDPAGNRVHAPDETPPGPK